MIGSKIYFHKDYALNILPINIFWYVYDIIDEYFSDFTYNCMCYDVKNHTLRFDEAPDFNTAREPHPGKILTLDLNSFHKTLQCKITYSDMIWHHKWLWVASDYEGFNVYQAYDWSKTWLSCITHPSGSLRKWNEELIKYGLPLDNV